MSKGEEKWKNRNKRRKKGIAKKKRKAKNGK